MRLQDELINVITSQYGIAVQAFSQPLELLCRLCDRTRGQLPKVAGWMVEDNSNILQYAVAHHVRQYPGNYRVHNCLHQQTTDSSADSNATCWQPAIDVVLATCGAEEQQQQPQAQQQQESQAQQQQEPQAQQQQELQGQQQQEPQAQQQQEPPFSPWGTLVGPPVAVGQFKEPLVLASCPAGLNEWTPVNLIEGFRNKDHKAVRVVSQVRHDQPGAHAVSLPHMLSTASVMVIVMHQ